MTVCVGPCLQRSDVRAKRGEGAIRVAGACRGHEAAADTAALVHCMWLHGNSGPDVQLRRKVVCLLSLVVLAGWVGGWLNEWGGAVPRTDRALTPLLSCGPRVPAQQRFFPCMNPGPTVLSWTPAQVAAPCACRYPASAPCPPRAHLNGSRCSPAATRRHRSPPPPPRVCTCGRAAPIVSSPCRFASLDRRGR